MATVVGAKSVRVECQSCHKTSTKMLGPFPTDDQQSRWGIGSERAR